MEFCLGLSCRSVLYGGALLLLLAVWIKWRQNYWKQRGFYQVPPQFFFGNLKDFFFRKEALGSAFHKVYTKIKTEDGKHGGLYMFLNPLYMPVDPELIKNIMSSDFNNFLGHGLYYDEEREPLTGHIFNLEGDKWRKIRSMVTPLFTSGRMKTIYKTFLTCTHDMMDLLNRQNEPVDIKDVFERLTIDVIVNCVYGVNCNTIANPDSDFRIYGKRIFERDWMTTISRIASNLLPFKICRILGIKMMTADVARFFLDIARKTVECRKKDNIIREDFMHFLLQLKNQGTVSDDEPVLHKTVLKEDVLSLNEIAAQCFIFFFAGYETSATTMTFALFELALNPVIQDKLRSEIRTSWELHGQSYDAIMKMSYLEKVIFEALRKYPPVSGTSRVSNRAYKIPGTNMVLEKGSLVHIPIIGVHMDPDYYPDPEKFDPERFDEELKASRPGCTWMPFGYGPRTCLGLRFGLLQSKIGLATIVNNFRISLSDKTRLPLEMDPCNFIYTSKQKIWINMEKL